MVYDEFQDFPKKRHALYGEALDVLLRKWASEKRIQRNPIYQELSAELELDMLAEIAYTSFVDDQLFFSKDRLINQIREFLIDNLNAPSHLDAETVLKEIEIQQGILVERARDAYSFSHLTFQEYLTAKCIVDNKKIDHLVSGHATEERWREVFLLVAGLVPGKRGADELLLAIERHSQAYANDATFKTILAWATIATEGSLGHNKASAKRAAAVFLALAFALPLVRALNLVRSLIFALDLDLTLGHARAIELALNLSLDLNLPFSLAREYQRLEIFSSDFLEGLINNLGSLESAAPDDKTSLQKRKEFALKTLRYFSNNLNFDFQIIAFSEEEIQKITDYFYTLELMIRCREAAVRVSPQVWAGIESRMVTVPD